MRALFVQDGILFFLSFFLDGVKAKSGRSGAGILVSASLPAGQNVPSGRQFN